ncbi:SGNH/GDSL hydrolase family protein [Corynebacterium liangguodongii]|uniref:Uncharacterized protein n=1 Tax=Corynebacterium liangguodongii TaxID=2079535 RepID=A0A2S0WBX7_9CORY|nr:SGNH/GDSL hydrolase family protein [Corynebacterium liangguodongii]AWB83182.1 hypothetical protein C3E79_00715 [Corynebacterium liangguodongii]PWB98777.1 SGNH/GDSL hydrolase family protein [Corynebacterium liangguodongii]
MKVLSRLTILAASAAAAIAGVAAAPAHAQPEPGKYHKYVAVGDSFASVGSITQFDVLDRPLCARSNDNYPRQLAARLGLSGPEQFRDESCGFARTKDYWRPQHVPLPFTNPSTQAEAITPDTDLVTVTLGGNPSTEDALAACLPAVLGFNGQPNPLSSTSSYPAGLRDSIEAMQQSSARRGITCGNGTASVAHTNRDYHDEYLAIVRDIQRRAPQAQVRVVGYFDVVGDPERTCPDLGGATLEDRLWIKNYINGLNDVGRQVAAETGTIFVEPPANPQGMCADPDVREASFLGVPDNGIPFHPNGKGQARVAEEIFKTL